MLPGKPVCLTQEPVCPTFEPVYSSVEPIWSKQKACHTKEPVSSKQEPVCTNHAPERKRTFSFSEPDRILPGLPKRTLSFSEQDRKVVSLPPRPSYSSRDICILSILSGLKLHQFMINQCVRIFTFSTIDSFFCLELSNKERKCVKK